MADKIYMDWTTFDNDVQIFIDYLHSFNRLDNAVILSLKRGAFPTSTALSNKLNIPISVVSFQTRDGEDSEPTFLEPDIFKDAKNIIIPDDIYDTGKTIETVIEKLINDYGFKLENLTGLFHYRTDNIFKSSLKFYRSVQYNENKWVVMPWE